MISRSTWAVIVSASKSSPELAASSSVSDQRRDLVQRRHRLVEQLADEGRLGVVAVHPEDVVEAPGHLAVARVLDRVLPDLVFERLDVVVDGVGRELLDELREDRDRFGVEVDLLEVRDPGSRRAGTIVPSGASQVGSRTLLALASLPRELSRDDPVELAPARVAGRVGPGVDGAFEPSSSSTSIWPAWTSSGVHDIGDFTPTGLPPFFASTGMLAELDLPAAGGPARWRSPGPSRGSCRPGSSRPPRGCRP